MNRGGADKPVVIITGATGFIGRALCREMSPCYAVTALSRDIQKARAILGSQVTPVRWDGRTADGWAQMAEGAAAVVNLAGENIGSGRWNKYKKDRILNSRLNAAEAVMEAIRTVRQKPGILIQASATGFYGDRGQALLNESSQAGEGFLADVCRRVELAVSQADTPGTRCAAIRTGLVLDATGGALPRMAMPFRLHLGGCPGNGRQFVSWISLADHIRAIRYIIENDSLSGAFNLTAPNPVTMRQFAAAMGKALGRSCALPVPSLSLRLLFGEMAKETILASQNATPDKLLEAGFTFMYEELEDCLRAIFSSGRSHMRTGYTK